MLSGDKGCWLFHLAQDFIQHNDRAARPTPLATRVGRATVTLLEEKPAALPQLGHRASPDTRCAGEKRDLKRVFHSLPLIQSIKC